MAHTELRHLLGVTTSNGLALSQIKKHRSTIRIGSGQVFTQVSSQPVSMPVDRTSLYAPAGAGHDHEIALEKFHYTRRTTLVICMQLIYLSKRTVWYATSGEGAPATFPAVKPVHYIC
jgi:hypothetical protein